MPEVSEAQKRAQKKYMEKFVEVKVRMTPEQRSAVQAHAQNMGESTTVLFPITEDALKFHDINMDYVVEPGTFTVYVGGDSTTENSAVFEVMA